MKRYLHLSSAAGPDPDAEQSDFITRHKRNQGCLSGIPKSEILVYTFAIMDNIAAPTWRITQEGS